MGGEVFVDGLLHRWGVAGEYAGRLVADLDDEAMRSQPVAGVVMNHPAWTFSHLSLYPPVLAAILRREPFVDPKGERFGAGSKPEMGPGVYEPKDALMGRYFAGRGAAAEALRACDRAILGEPPPLERWRGRFPTVADLLLHLMMEHEAQHHGQVSAWRRAGGRGAV